MAVKLRLQRLGRKKRAFYRLVAIDSRRKRDGLEIERLGWFNPVGSKNDNINIKEDRVLHWLEKGAQPSETVHGLFRRLGLNYKWHLMKQGMKGLELDKLMEEWKTREENRINSKHDKKIKKKELSVVKEDSEEAPAEEAPAEAAAEETPAEEAPAEAAAEEAPAEEAPAEAAAEEAPAEEAPAEAAAEEAPAEEAPAEAAAEEAPAEDSSAKEEEK